MHMETEGIQQTLLEAKGMQQTHLSMEEYTS